MYLKTLIKILKNFKFKIISLLPNKYLKNIYNYI